MSYLTTLDLSTHIYGENITAITRGNNNITATAICAGVAEAESYLYAYDTAILLNPEAEGYPEDENLKNKIKDLAAWHLVKLANPNINLELFRTSYEDALAWFDKIMKRQLQPAHWPRLKDNPDTPYVEGGAIQWASNKKRDNHY